MLLQNKNYIEKVYAKAICYQYVSKFDTLLKLNLSIIRDKTMNLI